MVAIEKFVICIEFSFVSLLDYIFSCGEGIFCEIEADVDHIKRKGNIATIINNKLSYNIWIVCGVKSLDYQKKIHCTN